MATSSPFDHHHETIRTTVGTQDLIFAGRSGQTPVGAMFRFGRAEPFPTEQAAAVISWGMTDFTNTFMTVIGSADARAVPRDRRRSYDSPASSAGHEVAMQINAANGNTVIIVDTPVAIPGGVRVTVSQTNGQAQEIMVDALFEGECEVVHVTTNFGVGLSSTAALSRLPDAGVWLGTFGAVDGTILDDTVFSVGFMDTRDGITQVSGCFSGERFAVPTANRSRFESDRCCVVLDPDTVLGPFDSTFEVTAITSSQIEITTRDSPLIAELYGFLWKFDGNTADIPYAVGIDQHPDNTDDASVVTGSSTLDLPAGNLFTPSQALIVSMGPNALGTTETSTLASGVAAGSLGPAGLESSRNAIFRNLVNPTDTESGTYAKLVDMPQGSGTDGDIAVWDSWTPTGTKLNYSNVRTSGTPSYRIWLQIGSVVDEDGQIHIGQASFAGVEAGAAPTQGVDMAEGTFAGVEAGVGSGVEVS